MAKSDNGLALQRNLRHTPLMGMGRPQPNAAMVVPGATTLPDAEIVGRILAGERGLFEILMRRYNQQLYRAARAVVNDEAEVEDIMQQAYFNAFTHLHQFEERARFSTWMTRIVLNEAFARRRKRQQVDAFAKRHPGDDDGEMMEPTTSQPDPERQAYGQELRRVLEDAVDALPESYRTVFMLRDVEGLSTSETGEGLGLGEEAVKTRLHRARAMIRRTVTARIGGTAEQAFQFHAPRCDRVVAAVLARIDRTFA
jgi:RNA polymerase sigma-70 factor, ECF subfamily